MYNNSPKPRLFTLSLCCISHRPSSVMSDSGRQLMMWWPLNVQWRGLLFLYLFCNRGETDSLGQDVLSATQQAGWESRQSVRGHIRSRKQPCLPQLSLHEWWLLWNVSLFLFPFLPVRISERCGSPLSRPPSFILCPAVQVRRHGWTRAERLTALLRNTDSTPGWESTMQQKMKIMLFARQEIRPVTVNLSACWDCWTGWGQLFFFFLSWKHFNVAALPSPSSPWVWRSVSHYWLPYIPPPPPPSSYHFLFPPGSLIELLSPTCQKLSKSNRFETTRNIHLQCFFFTESLWMLQWTNK